MSIRHAGAAEAAAALWAPRCPLCGASNDCAVSTTGRFDVPCWCSEVTMDPSTLARAKASGRGCVCRKCAHADAATAPSPGTPT